MTDNEYLWGQIEIYDFLGLIIDKENEYLTKIL